MSCLHGCQTYCLCLLSILVWTCCIFLTPIICTKDIILSLVWTILQNICALSVCDWEKEHMHAKTWSHTPIDNHFLPYVISFSSFMFLRSGILCWSVILLLLHFSFSNVCFQVIFERRILWCSGKFVITSSPCGHMLMRSLNVLYHDCNDLNSAKFVTCTILRPLRIFHREGFQYLILLFFFPFVKAR